MKGYYSFACLAVLLAVQTSTTHAQAGECGIYADSLAHPTDCTKYYKITMHSCPDGQLFNKDTKQCDLPENTSCGAQETTPQEVGTTPIIPDTTTVEPTTEAPLTTTPEPITTTDAPTTTPEPITTTDAPTTTPEPVTTTDAPTTTPEPVTTTEVPPTTTTPLETTVTEEVTTTLAPTTSTEPPVEPTTEPPTEPPTEIPTTTTTTTTTTTPAPTTTPEPELPYLSCPAVDDPNNKIRYAHETNCAYYYLCSKGNPQLYTCLTGNHFNPIKRTCNPINQAGCDRCPEVPVANVIVRLPHETVCQYYYRCDEAGGSSQLYTCTTGLHFSRAERTCKSASEALCTLLITDEQP